MTLAEQSVLLRQWLDAPDDQARRAVDAQPGGFLPDGTDVAALLAYAASRQRLTE